MRRSAFAGVAFAATVGAHLSGTGERPTAGTAIAAGLAVTVAGLCGPRRRAFRPRAALATLGLLAAAQAALHVILVVAPWLAGLTVHHAAARPPASALVAHAAVTIALGLLLARAERLVAAALRGAAALRRLILGAPRRRRTAGSFTRLWVPHARLAALWTLPVMGGRGPPVPAVT
jgi:hypothetical protein